MAKYQPYFACISLSSFFLSKTILYVIALVGRERKLKVVLECKKTSQDILEEIKKESINLGITPGLCVIMVGDDPASSVYVKNKEKACEKVGFYHKTYRLMSDTTQDQLLSVIEEVKNDCNIHGLIVQLPLPKHISEELILNSIPVDKDVDCFHPFNVGNILTKKKLMHR